MCLDIYLMIDRYICFLNCCCRRPEEVRGEEQKIKTANERALQEMRERMERELEEAKLELLEVGITI